MEGFEFASGVGNKLLNSFNLGGVIEETGRMEGKN